MEVYEEAFGPCATCGKEEYYYCKAGTSMWVRGSLYWTPLPKHIWDQVRPYLVHMFQEESLVQNILFIPEYSKPFCSAECASNFYEREK